MSFEVNWRDFLGLSSAGILGGITGSMPLAKAATEVPAPLAVAAANDGDSSLAKRPNIILFMPDEMRADSLACYGNCSDGQGFSPLPAVVSDASRAGSAQLASDHPRSGLNSVVRGENEALLRMKSARFALA